MIKQGTSGIVLPGISCAYIGGDPVYHKLPSGYTECSYVRSNANAWFATNLYLTSKSEVIADLQFEGSAGNVYGCYTGSNASDNFCLYAGSASSDAYIRWDGHLYRAFRPTSGTRYKIRHSWNGFVVDGTAETNPFTDNPDSVFTCANPFYVGNLANSSAAKLKGRIYRLTVKTNGGVVMDLVPCQNSSNVCGLYDVIGRTFYQSQGTAFTGA